MATTRSPITHVSDTARWVAMYRAMETERPDAIFSDRWARELAGPEGEEILRRIPRGRQMAWPMVVRTAVMDELILQAISRDGVDTVVNLASGLDTRPFRLKLPAALQWFDVDLPDMIRHKRTILDRETPRCHLEFLSADLADDTARAAVLDQVDRAAGRSLVITEGLLIYLPPEAVGALAQALHRRPHIAWWLTDLASPRLLKILARSWGPAVSAGNAPFRFAPAEGTAFFGPHGWREAEFRSSWEESLRLKRTIPLAPLWNLLGRLSSRQRREEGRRMSAIVMLQRR